MTADIRHHGRRVYKTYWVLDDARAKLAQAMAQMRDVEEVEAAAGDFYKALDAENDRISALVTEYVLGLEAGSEAGTERAVEGVSGDQPEHAAGAGAGVRRDPADAPEAGARAA